jgi:putative heme-binding domain-containing protein
MTTLPQAVSRWCIAGVRRWLGVFCWLLATSSALAAPEKWAHPGLTVTEGLELWLDAGRVVERLPGLHDGQPVGVWFDASGHGRNLTQDDPAARPVLRGSSDHPALRFHGEKSHLVLEKLDLSFREATVFVVVTPLANPGSFRGFLALNESGKNDYVTGLNIDLGPSPTRRCSVINAEGSGFLGAMNLLRDATDFGVCRRLALAAAPGAGGVRLWADGKLQGRRDRGPGNIRVQSITIGARRYNNEGGPVVPRDFVAADIHEVLVYSRVLTDEEHAAVEKYLVGRHGERRTTPLPRPIGGGKPLVSVANPPPVQFFVPGFGVRRLPIDLPNINNVRYRPDGKLVALGYNGNIYLLSDSKGTGIEDKADLFWENKGSLRAPIGMALTPPGYKQGEGVFIAAKGKLTLIVDTDGDGKADREIIVADGWKELPHGVDALGVALDAAGNIYFGLGTADYTNAYQVDRDGRGHYDLKSERGTVLKVSPDFRRREIVATGVRFTVGLGFNHRGDLFATDQEGATWLPNGNPFDELLHIQVGRHYGFPPRHPRHLPGVIDEPSVFDYGPQHQSTCGLVFNEGVNGGPTFGPPSWAHDALIAGYSRGKLYRTQLAHTPAGYVARTSILACLNQLTLDACVSPRGDLVIATHSGAPDWGSGPSGKGTLYKVSFTGRHPPQPALVWPAGPREVRIAFDAPLDPTHLADLARRVSIESGAYVRAGDRFESLHPPYDAVQRQLAEPRREVAVLATGLTPDRRTLVLTTAPHPAAVHYAVTLPGLGRPEKAEARPVDLPQHAAIDLDYDLSGVDAVWRPAGAGEGWSGWLPHLDLTVARALTAGSVEHERLWKLLQQPGTLTLRSRVDLRQMLRPAVQPGSRIDYTLPDEKVTLHLAGTGAIRVKTLAATQAVGDGRREVRIAHNPIKDDLLALEIVLDTGPGLALDVAWSTQEDPRHRPLPLHRMLVPWAPQKQSEDVTVPQTPPELRGGSWTHGREVFFSEQAQCWKCHQVRGQGGIIGPDLSNLIHRDYTSVLRDIRDPSAAINPDYIQYVLELIDGRVLSGTVRTEGDRLLIGDGTGRLTAVRRNQVDAMTPSAVSLMPAGLEKIIGPEKLRDLLTFLLTEPIAPAPLEHDGAPPPRRRAELTAALARSEALRTPLRKLHVVLAAGPKDHGPGEHDYPLWQRRWTNLLLLAEGVSVSTADGWPSPAQWEKASVVVFYSNNPAWSAARAKEMDAFLARGGGAMFIHYAVDGHRDVEALAERIGLAWRGGASKFRHGPLELDFRASRHAVARNLGKLSLIDESYWNLSGDPKQIDLLASGVEEGAARPLIWSRQAGKGRVFVSIPGHYTWSFDDPLFRLLLLRGIAWSAGESVDRFNDLAAVGARMVD